MIAMAVRGANRVEADFIESHYKLPDPDSGKAGLLAGQFSTARADL
jgi:hypothetical protein